MTIERLPPRPRPRKQRREWGSKRQAEIALIEAEKRERNHGIVSHRFVDEAGTVHTKVVHRHRYDTTDRVRMERTEDKVRDDLEAMGAQGGWVAWVTFRDSNGQVVGSRITTPLDAMHFFWATQTGGSPSAKRLSKGTVEVVGLREGEPPKPVNKLPKDLLTRARKAGYDRSFISAAVLPDWWDVSCEMDASLVPDLEIRFARFFRVPLQEVQDPTAKLKSPAYANARLRRVAKEGSAHPDSTIHAALKPRKGKREKRPSKREKRKTRKPTRPKPRGKARRV